MPVTHAERSRGSVAQTTVAKHVDITRCNAAYYLVDLVQADLNVEILRTLNYEVMRTAALIYISVGAVQVIVRTLAPAST